MKRLWIGVGLLAAILISGIWLSHRMGRAHLPSAADLDNAAAFAMAGDWQTASALTDRAKESWQYSWHLSASVANHRTMDEIDALFEELDIYRAREETAAYCAGCVYLAQRMRDLDHSFRLSWWNLL